MSKCKSVVVQFVVFALFNLASNDVSAEKHECKDICSDSFFLLPLTKDTHTTCQRGCRFFNIINLTDDHDVNLTKEQCYLSCDESYISAKASNDCKVGCDLALKKVQSEPSDFFMMIEPQHSKNIAVDSELDLLEPDILGDPVIRSQVEISFNMAYKIPETRIRTMPIEQISVGDASERFDPRKSTDWLDCAARNSGIPKWLLLSAILSAVLVALWLSFSTDKKITNEDKENSSDEANLVKNDQLENEEVPALPEKHSLAAHDCDKEVDFSLPPKYVIEYEKA